MIAARLLLSFCSSLIITQACVAQAPYAVGHYLRDRKILDRSASAYNSGDLARALEIHRTLARPSPGDHYWRAQLIWATGGSPDAELEQAFEQGFSYTPNVPPDSFEMLHSARLLAVEAQALTKRDTRRIQRCEKLIQRDQELASGSDWDSLAHRATVDTLDVLIREAGWPGSWHLTGSGVAIVLAHQHWDKAHFFEPYQALIEQECLAGRENWNVALLTLQQRIRHTARNKTDTITFNSTALADDDPALPMVAAISERLAANGSKHIWIHAADSLIAQAISDRIILEQPKDYTPPDMVEYLKSQGFDHPKALTDVRITLVIDPALPRDRFLYRMT